MEHAGFWAEFADNRTVIVIFTCLKFALIVGVATAVASVIIIFSIEWLQEVSRQLKAWLKRPNLWA